MKMAEQAIVKHPFVQSALRYLPLIFIGLWSVFLTGIPANLHNSDHLERASWLLAGGPTLQLRLEEPAKTHRPKKFEVSVRLNGSDPYLTLFAVPTELSGTLAFAVPPELLKKALKVEVKVAGLDENGCIIEGGAQQVERPRSRTTSLGEQEIRVVMHALPQALCMQ